MKASDAEHAGAVPPALSLAMMFGGVAGLTWYLTKTMWADFFVFVAPVAILFFYGLFRWMPWKTPMRKAISSGVFVGFSISSGEWAYRLLS